ncbi:MAG: transglycosylase SLT domain-containing protein, partial [Acidobacteriia bacterium]|nr:transglycosylase SLT domain-containing protein [Terriglobia bacterium]
SEEANTASLILSQLESRMAAGYPPVTATAMLGRATKLSDAGKHKQAIVELNEMLPKLAGLERDLAQVRIGAARLRAGETLPALSYLTSLEVKSPEADAERLHYASAAARRAARLEEAHQALSLLDQFHAQSPWRMETLVSLGNYYLLINEPEQYEPLYRACADSFQAEPRAAYCHWKVTWKSYLDRQASASSLLKRHLELFPESEQAAAALYYLGRLSEASGDAAAAKAYQQAIVARYPNYYYAVLARERLSEKPVSTAGVSPSVIAFLSSLRLAPAGSYGDFGQDSATKLRIDRARLLSSAGFPDLAETELRFAARTDSKPALLAIELAQSASRRGAVDISLRYIKSVSPGYLNWDLESAPSDFWLLAFPMPFKQSLEKRSKENDLDPNMVAALVRQESEFDPKAVSSARAVGLTQVLPGTGREISRKLGIRYSASMLYQADSNLQLGTFYLKRLVDSLGGRWEAALAAYNAGKTRAVNWLTWGQFREPSEFIETIPFSETRNYVQTVLRNADIYRRLYSTTAAAVPSSGGNSSSQAVRSAGRPNARPRPIP